MIEDQHPLTAEGQLNEHPTKTFGNFIGSAVTTAALFGGFKYRNSTGLARSISKFLDAAGKEAKSLAATSARAGAAAGDKGSITDVMKLAFNADGFKDIKPAIEKIEARRTQPNQATIRDYLFQEKNPISNAESIDIRAAIGRLKSAHNVEIEQIYNLPIGQNVIFEDGVVKDLRSRSLKGLAFRALDWTEENIKIPFMDFALHQ